MYRAIKLITAAGALGLVAACTYHERVVETSSAPQPPPLVTAVPVGPGSTVTTTQSYSTTGPASAVVPPGSIVTTPSYTVVTPAPAYVPPGSSVTTQSYTTTVPTETTTTTVERYRY